MTEFQTRLVESVASLRDAETAGGRLGFRGGCYMAHRAGVTWEAIAATLGTTPAALRRRLDRIYEEVHAT